MSDHQPAPIGGRRYFGGTASDNAVRDAAAAVANAVRLGADPDTVLRHVVNALAGVSLSGPVERHTARLVTAAYHEGMGIAYLEARAAERRRWARRGDVVGPLNFLDLAAMARYIEAHGPIPTGVAITVAGEPIPND